MVDPLPPSLLGRPFTVSEAISAGVSVERLRGPSVRRLHHGVYAGVDTTLTLAGRVHAARLVLAPDTVVTGVTGLHLWGVTLDDPDPLTFVTTHPRQVRRSGIRVIRVSVLPRRKGVVALPAACFVTAAPQLGLADAVAAGDWLVRLRRTTPEQLVSVASQASGRGSVTARDAASFGQNRGGLTPGEPSGVSAS